LQRIQVRLDASATHKAAERLDFFFFEMEGRYAEIQAGLDARQRTGPYGVSYFLSWRDSLANPRQREAST
jgi:hypothetical protein